MKKTVKYYIKDRLEEREINYIPFRYIFAMLITLLEVASIIAIVVALCYYVPYFYLTAWCTQIACVVRIAASDDNPDYKVPWLLFVLIVPIAGFMMYFLFYSRTLKKKYVRRLSALKDGCYRKDDSALFEKLHEVSPTACSQAKMLCNISESHLFAGAKQAYFPSGEEMWRSMLEDLKKAERFVFLEYFIIEEGEFWGSILEILKDKASKGVEVRLVYDDIGCMSTLPGDYWRTLKRYGIQAVPFSRLKGNADSEFNNRSHRKIMVIDGKVGYTGGVNIADEYINRVVRFGHWKDTGLRLEGEAVWELTRLFLIDYGINARKLPAMDAGYFPAQPGGEEGWLIPFGDGPAPLYRRRVGKSAIQNMLSCANRYVYMTTPYLIIDNDLCQSIENAAIRGVDVKIILPHIPDKKLVFCMTRSFYPRLMAAGVEIYEYTPGFIHTKNYLADGEYAMTGTINLDYRSLVHHFENGVWMYRCASIRALEDDFMQTLAASRRVRPDELKASLLQRAVRSLVRILAPLL